MRLLLDTHIAVWAALDPDALTAAERRLMAGVDSPLVLSAVSVWELRLKWHSFHVSGGRKGPLDPATIIAFAEAIGWEFISLTARHAVTALADPIGHKNPFDELLLVQAQAEDMRLLTRDAKLAGHPLVVPSL
ncbi:type II toxin-antitoxin system VapC family toxin [Acidisoma silvae]|uniref:Type II toxin-antitoxin system VapC family toxin n=1 Tax=Acidisoma silvae TaxID=2802396 RepID=A0A963YPT1_9PROT|nr:type II toxin-antitoxin system VapC family toxin [Acidisoma silvae]MCB8874040.1 type II toxin-antitoxin system VapC family toxin [Acidisoma silvae]